MNRNVRINEEIRVKEVRLIDSEGTQLGIMDINKAREIADAKGLDLVEVSPEAKPPVCRVLDYGKYRFEQAKKIKESKKKQKVVLTKEIRMRPKIEEHDYNTKMRQTVGFLQKGNKVKVSMRFRGRERAHTDIGREVIDRMILDVSEVGVTETPPRLDSWVIVTVLAPKKAK